MYIYISVYSLVMARDIAKGMEGTCFFLSKTTFNYKELFGGKITKDFVRNYKGVCTETVNK